jgi:hypothetical protein
MRNAMNRFAIALAAWLVALNGSHALAVPSTSPSTQPIARTGDFEITFTDRSPLSVKAKLMDRLADKDIGPDYDLSEQPFVIYVPPDYSADKPVGVVVYMSQDGANLTPATLQPVLNKRHLIFIMARKSNLSLCEETGLSIDAIFNLKTRYHIDDRRIFLMGSGWTEDVGLATPDVFAGDVWIWNTGYWKTFLINRTQTYQGNGHAPSSEMLTLAKHRPHVFGFETDNYNDGIRSLVPGQMTRDGFEHMFKAVIAGDDISYPGLKAEWFGKMLDMLESVSMAKPNISTQPSGPSAASLLELAKAYLSAGKTDLAKEKLKLLIQKYPAGPAAENAKKLLAQIP